VIDYQKLTKDFSPGDSVQKYMPGDPGGLSPFVGRVTSVHVGIGCLDVQWPFGVERVQPDEIVRVNPALRRYLPPTLDQTYDSYDVSKGRQAGPKMWRTVELPAGFHRDLAVLWARKASEVSAYDHLWRKYTTFGAVDDDIKDEVGKFYLVARNLVDFRIQQGVLKSGAYWVSQNRQYRVTQDELETKKPFCPKCGTKMRRTTYKMEEGSKHRLWACPKDLFLIKQDHMLGPGGEPVQW
jgi:ribosomal protein S27AE